MAVDKKQLELDRIVNMLKTFGWSIVSSQFQGDKISISFEKVVKEEGV